MTEPEDIPTRVTHLEHKLHEVRADATVARALASTGLGIRDIRDELREAFAKVNSEIARITTLLTDEMNKPDKS